MAGSHQIPVPEWLITPRLSEKFFPKADAALNVGAKATMKSGTGPLTKLRFPVDGKIRSRHTANGVLKQAGLPKQF
jgi:hypothetical protein